MTSPFKRFFLFCSGASSAILKMSGCEVEHNKYAGIGVTILFTATLAAISGGYAIFTVFKDRALSFAFALLWGLIIFNLDRFIVTSIRKPLVAASAPFTARLAATGSEILKALPRLLLAVFISIVITRPLELKLFEAEIEGQITKDLTQERVDLDNDLNAEYVDITNLESENEKLRLRIVELQNEWSRRIMVASNELEGGGGTGNPGDGPEYRRRLAERDQAERELNAFKEQYAPIIKANESQIEKQKEEKAGKAAAAKSRIDNSHGLLKRLEALSKLTTLDNLPAFLASGFIVLLFVSLETAPIFVKLFSRRGPYDDYLDAIEHQVYATQQKTISDTNDDINTRVALSKQLNADRLQMELQLSRNTMSSLQALAPQDFHDAQVEIARKAIALWRNSQLNAPGYVAQPATAANQSASVPATPTSPQNIPQTPGPAGAPTPAGAAGAPPVPVSPPNNGGNHRIPAAAAAGAHPSAPAATTQGPFSPAQQTSPAAGQQGVGVVVQSPAGSNSNASTP